MQKKVTWKARLGAFIPRYIPNRIVCGVMSLLGVLHRTSKRKREENRAHNRAILGQEMVSCSQKSIDEEEKKESAWFAPGEYIENQPQWEKLRFGNHSTISYSGCEILAIYNARMALGECLSSLDLIELIEAFEKKGAVWAGLFGSAPRAICKYFRKRGYDIKKCFLRNENRINEIGTKNDTVVAMFYNDVHDIFKMIHTVNVSKDAAGKYWVHNCYKRRATTYMSDGPYEDLWSAIHNKESGERAVLCVMGIRKNSCIGEEKRV